METPTIDKAKQADPKSSREIAQQGANLADLLRSAHYGARVAGLVLVVEEPRNFTGKNSDGSSYSTWSRRIQLFAGAGAGTVVCGERQDKFEDFKPLELGQEINTHIVGCRTDGKQMVFRIKL